ncbi:MAG: SAP domain-containing protein [Planctomycetota bacterium]|jgi:hypothetical protein
MQATEIVEKPMKMPEVRVKARSLGLTPGRRRKAELIHAIQMAEGYSPCFGRSDGRCANHTCCFMRDCVRV